ncbi:MAG: hypothetical protein IIB57_12375, partial [Planctomycetes bacterium]|nr:hypothetical protein [Planctomycetota bacterium]
TQDGAARREKGVQLALKMIDAAKRIGTDNLLVVPGAVYIPWLPDVEPVPNDVCDRRARAAIRRMEVECEARTLGFTPHFLDLEIYDEHTVTTEDEVTLSETLNGLRSAGPRRLLILPGRNELHQTHRLASDLVRKVVEDRHAVRSELPLNASYPLRSRRAIRVASLRNGAFDCHSCETVASRIQTTSLAGTKGYVKTSTAQICQWRRMCMVVTRYSRCRSKRIGERRGRAAEVMTRR